jgi:hypothetical protein
VSPTVWAIADVSKISFRVHHSFDHEARDHEARDHEARDHEARSVRFIFGAGRNGEGVSANRFKIQINEMLEVSGQPWRSIPVRHHRNGGIALVTVLAVTLLVLGLLTLITGLTTRSARITRTDAAATALAQLADGYSDVARVVLAENLRLSRLPAGSWLDLISLNRAAANPTLNPTDPKVVKLAGNHLLLSNGATLGWEIKAVSASSERPLWVRVAATAQDSSGHSQTVVRRVQFDLNKIFDLAMLADDVNCMFCHLKVEGDVGSMNGFRPGWGTESEGKDPCAEYPNSTCGVGSGKGSQINGNVYVRSRFTRDRAGPGLANDAVITGGQKENFTGDPLPSNDKTGVTEFPGLDRTAARNGAKGTLSGGSISGIAPGGVLNDQKNLDKVSGVYDGNLVLDGSTTPIILNGDIYVSGDVVIKGVVSGRGAIYAGRNVYVAGDLTNKNRADKPGEGECKNISNPDKCAQANIAAGKDELRLSAGNNIILGNFTEEDSSGKQLSRRDRQAADYFRDQFGLAQAYPLFETRNRFVRKGSSEELRVVATPGKPDAFVDQLGNPVATSEVQKVSGDAVYEHLIAPGQTGKDGQFSRWMSDAEYQAFLGKEEIKHGLWRTSFRFDDPSDPKKGGVTPEQYQNTGDVNLKVKNLVKELEASGFPQDTAFLEKLAKTIIENPQSIQTKEWIQDFSGKTAGGQQVSGRVSFDGSYLRVAMIEPYQYAKEVMELDAFLYANNRIAGKLGPRGGYINGGMIARELGVLAPGRNGYNRNWLREAAIDGKKLSPENQRAFAFCNRSPGSTDSVGDADNSTIYIKDTYIQGEDTTENTCNYAIRYDHRLRNGGYGFNLYQGTSGITSDWSFDLTGDQKVSLP